MTNNGGSFQKVYDALVELGVEPGSITREAQLRYDLDIDSAELVEVVTEIAPGKVDGKLLRSIDTVGDLSVFLDREATAEEASAPSPSSQYSHTEHTVTVSAPRDLVWEILVDVENYPNLFEATQSAEIVEKGVTYELVKLEVDVSGKLQAWTSRRDIDSDLGVIAYRQLETAPMVEHMGGEWRVFSLGADRAQLVITHDFAARKADQNGMVAGEFTFEQASEMLANAVERNSVAHLGAIKTEAELRSNREATVM
ncbi:SRPBCC family protein [Dietzia timorensis]|uniref:SRPBCC family protein n=1 Tax=Dietzia timorensis TaxID=499555 RepID=UPI0008321695|nr:SRPBCC family protein [Dietzia timorensis]